MNRNFDQHQAPHGQQPPQYGYPQPQSPAPYYLTQFQQPYYQPTGIPLHTLIQQIQESRTLAVENVHLHNRLAQRNLVETANTETFKSWDKKIFTQGRNGTPRLLLSHTIDQAIHFIPQPPSRQQPFFYICLHEVEMPLVLSESDFFKDSRLIFALQELPGVEVTPRRSQKLTAMLLRQAMSQHLRSVYLDSYAGWAHTKDGIFRFSLFPGFSTHRRQDQYEPSAPVADVSKMQTVVAAQRFWPVFNVIRDLFARHLLILWFHTAALTSLLEQLGYHIPLALDCFATDPDQRRYLKRLFGWFRDDPLSLDLRPADFADGLLARRDQPLVIEEGQLEYGTANAQTLESLLSTGTVCWQSGKERTSLPIQALATIISSGASDLTCNPAVFDLDLPPESFDRDHWLTLPDSVFDNRDYLTAFASYTSDHITDLQTALSLGREQALKQSQGGLNEKCLDTYGILLGMSAFLADFFEFCSPVEPPIPDMLNEVLQLSLFERLEQTSEKEQLTDLADVFLAVARQQLQQGVLSTCPQKNFAPDRENLVVFNDEYLHFTSDAFRCVCGALHQTYPVILNALADAGLFCGRQTNARTAQTRISVWDDHGERRSIPGYSFSRDAFDLLGDPLVLDEEVCG